MMRSSPNRICSAVPPDESAQNTRKATRVSCANVTVASRTRGTTTAQFGATPASSTIRGPAWASSRMTEALEATVVARLPSIMTW